MAHVQKIAVLLYVTWKSDIPGSVNLDEDFFLKKEDLKFKIPKINKTFKNVFKGYISGASSQICIRV